MSTVVVATAFHLECIDGKDDHFVILVEPGHKKILGGFDDDAIVKIKELEHNGGAIIISNDNGQLLIDASDCAVPVKINGNIISRSPLKTSDILKIGSSIWKAAKVTEEIKEQINTADKSTFSKSFGSILGLDELKDFKLSTLFSEVFKKHSLAETEEQMVTGTSKNIPSLTDIEISWAKPWLFSRMLMVSVILTVVLVMGFRAFTNNNLVPGIIMMGSFAVPVSVLVFFLEMNAPRNISIFLTMALLFVGGVASLIVTLLFFQRLDFFSGYMGASAAGIIEETAKILCVIFIMGKFSRYKWVLNGLLFGAAIGTGFAAFESAGYAFRIMLNAGLEEGVDNIILRGVLAPFGHIIWTGNAAAALWLVKGNKKFSWNMVKDGRFLRVFASSMILHMIWNADFSIFPVPVFLDVKLVLLGIIGWAITFHLVQQGLNQLNAERHAEIERLRAS